MGRIGQENSKAVFPCCLMKDTHLNSYILSIFIAQLLIKLQLDSLLKAGWILYFSVTPEQLKAVRDKRAGPMTALAVPGRSLELADRPHSPNTVKGYAGCQDITITWTLHTYQSVLKGT